ncbi:hypothetical protein ASE92_10685 [Pedobacter sp. Leaf41]|uniref:hypothetical protein n=1 Tax=Pedobacter sp. Leaf41 TaxID=1736218 RepID=UPI0007025BC8|nr:hypothetical protein [Pedobacter sp. Leaf41]KQN35082.1 hypothetical protein ASE92_10685 [Pedobacter sp. Leaf41]RZL34778.1 MAG: hypothetical protein EOO96_08660 [Pedobacter sp.]
MSNVTFFFANKERLKFLLKCIAIGMPILLLSAWAINSFEDKEAEKGEANDKGGMNYYYREGSGADKYPEPVAKLLQMYPGSQATYINVSTDKNNELEGDIYSFTADDISKVYSFYKKGAKVIDDTPERVELEKNGQNFVITKEKVLEDDPIKGETKFGITFYNKATVNKYKTN